MGTITAQVQLTEAELKLLQTLVYQECGMFFDERRSHFLKDRLQRRLKACQLDSFYAYYRLLTSREDGLNWLSFLRISPSTKRVSFAIARSLICCKSPFLRTFSAANRSAAITRFGFGVPGVLLARNRTPSPF
jgi:hypothetical protein